MGCWDSSQPRCSGWLQRLSPVSTTLQPLGKQQSKNIKTMPSFIFPSVNILISSLVTLAKISQTSTYTYNSPRHELLVINQTKPSQANQVPLSPTYAMCAVWDVHGHTFLHDSCFDLSTFTKN